MRRFQQKKQTSPYRNLVISLLLFLLITGVFYFGIQSLSTTADHAELQTLTDAIQRNVVLCYTLEGSYPESLAYLKEHYGLRYDEDKYFVAYEVLGENIMPDITIIRRNEDGV